MIARWWPLVYLLLAAQHCLSYNQQRHKSPFQDALTDDGVDSGPEDLFLEELVRNMKWAAANREEQQQLANRRPYQQHREQPSVDDVFELLHDVDDVDEDESDDERIAYQFNRERPAPSKVRGNSHRPFAVRPSDPGFYPERQPVVAEEDPVISPEPLPVSPSNSARKGQKEDIFGEAGETRQQQQEANEKFRPVAASTPSTPVRREEDELVGGRSAREPIAHAIVSEPQSGRAHDSLADIYLTALVAGCTASAAAALLGLGVCFYRWHVRAKAAQEVEYPAYGVTGPGPCQSGKSSLKSSPTTSTPGTIGGWSLSKSPKAAAQTGDKKLAHSAHMFHFQHQKQQVIALENSNAGCDRTGSNSGGESDEDNEEGDYTVYECPGLAPTGEMEVKNPLFLDDPTPASPALKRQTE